MVIVFFADVLLQGPRKYSEIYGNVDFRNEEVKVEKNVSFNDPSVHLVVHMNRFTASWDKEEGEPVLKQINVALQQRQLLAVVGPVAAGELQLMCAIMHCPCSESVCQRQTQSSI